MISKLTNPDVIEFIQENLNEDPSEIALKANKFPELPIREIASQIASRQKGRKKLPEWFERERLIFPPKENLEQASSQESAEFKASIYLGDTLLDLTGGTGIDAYYLANNFKNCMYVEPDQQLCEIATHNFDVLKSSIKVYCSSAEAFLSETSDTFDLIYVDPSRRSDTKQRLVQIEDYQPNVIALMPELLKKSNRVLVKVSPMIDIKQSIKQLQHAVRVICLAIKNEMKEVLFELGANGGLSPIIETVNLDAKTKRFTATFDEENKASFEISEPKRYIYEPNSAIRKAGFFKLIGEKFQIEKLDTNTHLYSSETLLNDFPGKTFKLQEMIKPDKKMIRKNVSNGIINVISKNYPLSANEIKKRYKLKDGGDQFLIFCKVEELGNVCLKCDPIS